MIGSDLTCNHCGYYVWDMVTYISCIMFGFEKYERKKNARNGDGWRKQNARCVEGKRLGERENERQKRYIDIESSREKDGWEGEEEEKETDVDRLRGRENRMLGEIDLSRVSK